MLSKVLKTLCSRGAFDLKFLRDLEMMLTAVIFFPRPVRTTRLGFSCSI